MKETGNSENDAKQMEIWKERLNKMDCPAYLIRNVTDFPIVAGNQAFYEMAGVKPDRQAMRLASVLNVEPYYKALYAVREKNPFVHRCRDEGQPCYLLTSLQELNELEGTVLCISYDLTQYVVDQQELEHYKQIGNFIYDQVSLEVFEWDTKSGIVRIFSQIEVLNQLQSVCEIEEFKEQLEEYFSDRKSRETLQEAFESMEEGKKEFFCELSCSKEKGKRQWKKVSFYRGNQKPGRTKPILGMIEDITKEKEAILNYMKETQFYHMMLTEKEGYGHVDITQNKILYMGGIWNIYNELIHEVTYEELIKAFIYKVVHQEDREHYLELMLISNIKQSYENGITKLGCEFRRFVEQNKMIWMRITLLLFCEPISGHLLGLFYLTNIDEEKKRALFLQYESQRDQLTNIYNKKMTEMMTREHLKQADENEFSAFILLDLDNFKKINDTYGHKTGDQVLVFLVAALGETFRKNDIIGRFGGDEFVILVKNVSSAALIAERLEELFKKLSSRNKPKITCSAGVSLARGGSDYDEIFNQADKALYEAKCGGKGRYQFYHLSKNKEDSGEGAEREERRPEQGCTKAAEYEEIRIGGSEAISGETCWGSEGNLDNISRTMQNLLKGEGVNGSFDSFVGQQGDMAYLVDPSNYDLLCGNQAFYDRIGTTERECIGVKCYEAMHRRKTPCPFCSKANWSADKFFIWKDINSTMEQEFLIKNKLVNWNNKEVLLALAIDISNDKSISELVNSGTSESHILVSTVQQMDKSTSRQECIMSVLDSVGHFYRAAAVCYWELKPQNRYYECTAVWKRDQVLNKIGEDESLAVTKWLKEKQWNGVLFIESPEDMLANSFEMYQVMRSYGMKNIHALQLNESSQEYGCIFVMNGVANIRNETFLESIGEFLVSEIQKKKMMEDALYAQIHDKLTDLLNRNRYEKYLQTYDPDSLSCIGVVAANIDNLKGINGSRGYLTGNYFIKQFAQLLNENFPNTSVYRLNGDEFVVIAEDMERLELEQCLFLLSEAMAKEDYRVSIGYGWDNVEKDLQELIENATKAMRINKKKHYDSGMIAENEARNKMLTELLSDIKRGEYEIYLQPKFNMEQEELIGAEALIRHLDDKRGVIPPSEFIPVLEANNLIRYVDLFVMEQVCRLQERWKKRWGIHLIISLNFSRITLLEEHILDSIEDILGQYEIDRRSIEIEITESFVAGGKSTLYRVAQELYDAGCNLSLDDFGVKYTNISMLADIDFHTLKLDKSLIKALEKKESNQIILKNIIRLCQDMEINVIAEGVETKEQEEVLRNLGCAWGQGYLFGKPMTVREFEERYLEKKE